MTESLSPHISSQNPESIQPQSEPQIIIQQSPSQHISHASNRSLTHKPSHKIVTRSKSGIFKPKLYTTALINKEPDTIQETLSDQN